MSNFYEGQTVHIGHETIVLTPALLEDPDFMAALSIQYTNFTERAQRRRQTPPNNPPAPKRKSGKRADAQAKKKARTTKSEPNFTGSTKL
jgi:hypothetical protein